MTLRSKFILFCVCIHALFLFLAVQLLPLHKYLFLTAELLIVCSIGLSIWLYRAISHPLHLIASGIESMRDKDFNSRLTPVGHPEMDELIGVYNQMIDQLREERLTHTEKNYFLEKLIQASPSGVLVLNFEDKIASLNPAAAAMLGLSYPLSPTRSLTEVPGGLAYELTQMKTGEAKVIRVSGIRIYKCQKSHFIDQGYAQHFILLEELTEELHQKEKNAYEKVIRMMSHEINNSIGAINSILQTCLTFKNELNPDHQDDYANALQVSIGRNNSLSGFMSNFAKVVRLPEPVKEPVDVCQLLCSIQTLMEAFSIQKQITWHWELHERPLFIYADAPQLEQVLINILKNAVEAIDQEGDIHIQTQTMPPRLQISDTGKGISKEVSQQLFSPFFSTKKNGQGIGLTLIKEILLNHEFKFSLESPEKNRTQFTIYF